MPAPTAWPSWSGPDCVVWDADPMPVTPAEALRDLDQHPLREPAREVERHHLGGTPNEGDPAALAAHLGVGQQALNFVGQQGFDSARARQEQGAGLHGGRC